MADNRRIDQFWDEYGSRYFVEPTRDGMPVPWEGSLMYRTYPFALAIYDDTLVKTVDQLHQNQRLHIIYLAVDPKMQHHGIAARLMQEAIDTVEVIHIEA